MKRSLKFKYLEVPQYVLHHASAKISWIRYDFNCSFPHIQPYQSPISTNTFPTHKTIWKLFESACTTARALPALVPETYNGPAHSASEGQTIYSSNNWIYSVTAFSIRAQGIQWYNSLLLIFSAYAGLPTSLVWCKCLKFICMHAR